MNLSELKSLLAQHRERTLRFVLPTGSKVPPHAHVTEVALVEKKFIDCGGTFRTESLVRLQTWFQDDTDHRLTAGKLMGILEKSSGFIRDDSLPVEIEHEAPFISQFPIAHGESDGGSLALHLGIKHTDCLAQELCAPPNLQGLGGFKPLASLNETSCCGGGR